MCEAIEGGYEGRGTYEGSGKGKDGGQPNKVSSQR